MADAVAGLQAAGFGAVTPAYRWSAAERDGEHWVVRFPRDGEGLGVCRIETRQMAETLAAMLIDAFSLGAASNYQAKWDGLRRWVSAEMRCERREGTGVAHREVFTAGAFEYVLEQMDETDGGGPPTRTD
jgi:hypothetical protein